MKRINTLATFAIAGLIGSDICLFNDYIVLAVLFASISVTALMLMTRNPAK